MTVIDKYRFQEKLDQNAMKNTKFRVLIVDDEVSILELVKTALETLEDYDVEVASSAADALERVMDAERPFDCFLLDIQMPDMDGIELLQEIRVLEEYAQTPILMLTAMCDRKYIDHAFIEGASDYVNKPFDFLELRSRIQRAHAQVEARKTSEADDTAQSVEDCNVTPQRQFSFEDPLSTEGAKRSLRYVEFDNYVAQLARRKLFTSQAISVILRDAEMFYNLAGCADFHKAICYMADGIQSVVGDFDCVFSYRGEGVFLLIIHGRTSSDVKIDKEYIGEYLGAQIRQQIDDERIEILVGQAVSLRVLSRWGATNQLNKAVSIAQHLEQELNRASRHPFGVETSPTYSTPAQDQRNTYEMVLNELYGEESYLSQR